MTLSLENRIEQLEDAMVELARSTIAVNRVVETFVEEMQQFKAEMRAEMHTFKAEMEENRAQAAREMREFRQELGRISNRFGRLAEDIVAPSVPGILRKLVSCPAPVELVGVRSRRYYQDRMQEYDVIAFCGEYLLVNETKSNLRPQDVLDFLKVLRDVHLFIPEHQDKKLIGALASFHLDHSIVSYGESQGLVMLGMNDDFLQMLNSQDFVPKIF